MFRVRKNSLMLLAVGAIVGAVTLQIVTRSVNEADAAGGKVKSPTGAAPDRYVYYPGTEELQRNEIRVIACV